MEKRVLKVSFNDNGRGSATPKTTLPKKWLDILGITIENREIELELDEEHKTIIIKKKD